MFLWKIRQFPTFWQSSCNLRNRISKVGFCLAALLFAGISSIPLLSAQQTTDKTQPEANKADPAKASNSSEALDYLRKAHEALVQHTSIQAKLVEQVAIGDRRFQMEGSYAGAGLKLRLEFQIQIPGGASGSLLEVCDGDVLWSRMDLPDSRRVTRRDVRQILKAVTASKSAPDGVLLAELGLGGLPGLLSSLERTMEITQMREDSSTERPMVVLHGAWKKDFVKRWQSDPQGQLPPYIPDEVRLFFDRETQFPARILYLKRDPEGKGLNPMVSLEFREVVLDGPVKEQQFLFVPPDDVAPQDITRQYLDQIQQANAPAAKPAEKK